MAVGIRGTSGWLEVLDKQTVLVYVLEGTVEVTVTDPVSGESKTDAISAGESAIGIVYDPQQQLELGEKCDILRQTYTENDTNGFVLEELAQNNPLVEDIYQESGLDYRDLTPEEAEEQLQADQEEVHQKLEELDRAQESQNQQISVDPVGKPKPVNPGNSGGSSGGGNPPEASNRLPATATVPEILAALNQFDTVYVGDGVTSIRPFDAALPVNAGKTLQLDGPAEVAAGGSLTVDGTVHAAADLVNNGAITVNSRNTLYVAGSLRSQGLLTVTATGRAIVDGTISGNVDLDQGAELRFKQHDQLTLPRNWPVPAAPDSDGYYAPTFHEIYNVIFFTAGGSTIDTMEVFENSVVPKPADPTRIGHTFGGWFTNPRLTNLYDFDTPVTSDVRLYAKWIPLTYTVVFDSQGGSAVDSVTAEHDDIVLEPVEPTRSGYLFDGWYQDAECTAPYDFFTPVTGDITLYAKWATACTINFVTSGDPVASVTVKAGSKLNKPDATHPNYTIVTWYTDSTYSVEYNFSASVTGDLTLYAQWWQGQESNGLLWQVEDGGQTLILGSNNTNSAKIPSSIDKTLIKEIVFIGSGITRTDTRAFSGCTSLEKIELPETLESLGILAFEECSSLTNIRIPDQITQIPPYTFENCTQLTTVTLPAGLTTIGQGAFDGCTSLAGIELPSGLKTISMEAFIDCTSLSSIQIPDSVQTIGDYAFKGCSNLVDVELPDSLTELGPGVFQDCSNLTSITLPSALTKIGYYAFMNCSKLTQITYEGTSNSWNAITVESLAIPEGTKIICADGVILVAQPDGSFQEETTP